MPAKMYFCRLHEAEVLESLLHFDFLTCGLGHRATRHCKSTNFALPVVLTAFAARVGVSVPRTSVEVC